MTNLQGAYLLYFRPHGCPCGYLTVPRKECHCTPRQFRELVLSARAHNKVRKGACTITDLNGAGGIRTQHVTEAIQYRSLDRNLWAWYYAKAR